MSGLVPHPPWVQVALLTTQNASLKQQQTRRDNLLQQTRRFLQVRSRLPILPMPPMHAFSEWEQMLFLCLYLCACLGHAL